MKNITKYILMRRFVQESSIKKVKPEWYWIRTFFFITNTNFLNVRCNELDCTFSADINNGYTTRFLGFSVYVSNTTDRLQGTLCFKDNHFNRTTIPDVFTTTCSVHGQYVIYYNERLSGVIYPTGYSHYADNELCELEVYGKISKICCFEKNESSRK